MSEQEPTATLATEASLPEFDGKTEEVLSAVDEKLDVEAVAQLVEHLDFSDRLNRRLQNAFGDLRRRVGTHSSAIGEIQREIRDLIMDVALLKRALTSLGQIGVIERRRIERELILELFPPRQVRPGTGVEVANLQRRPATMECESRLPLCKAACCRIFNILLTPQEVERDLYEWNSRLPYAVQKNRVGCMYLAAGGCSCSTYDHRPVACSNYSCEKDRRIWASFEKRELNPDLRKRLETLEVRAGASGAGAPHADRATEPSIQTDAVAQASEPDTEPEVAPPDFSALREMIIPEPERKFVPPEPEADATGFEDETTVDCSEDPADMARTDSQQPDTTGSEEPADTACFQKEAEGDGEAQSRE
ncbi:MAG: YkgJ family cysteine cluster protein [Planctomycetes bacterium]|nr:YkgJ family cysteine cluster protein [Planctomycetota bacterium]